MTPPTERSLIATGRRVRPLLKQRQGREIRVSDNKPYFKFHLLLLLLRLRPTHESTNARKRRKSFFLLW